MSDKLIVQWGADVELREPPPLPGYKSWSTKPYKRSEARFDTPLERPIVWLGNQWAVTGYGIEARDGRYAIRADRLDPLVDYDERVTGYLLEEHVGRKTWVDAAEFRAALAIGIDHHVRQPRMARLRAKAGKSDSNV